MEMIFGYWTNSVRTIIEHTNYKIIENNNNFLKFKVKGTAFNHCL
jgi:hypothetical protein